MLEVRSFKRQHLRAASDTYTTCHQVESVLDRSYPNKMVGLLVDVESTQSIKLLKTCSWGHVGKGSTKGLLWVAVLPVVWLPLLTMHYPDNCVFCFHPEENANGKPWVTHLLSTSLLQGKIWKKYSLCFEISLLVSWQTGGRKGAFCLQGGTCLLLQSLLAWKRVAVCVLPGFFWRWCLAPPCHHTEKTADRLIGIVLVSAPVAL